LVALALLWPFVAQDLAAARPRVKRNLSAIALVAALMITGTLLSVAAVHFTTATNATLINATQPATTALAGWLIARERLGAGQLAGIALALAGIAVMVFRARFAVLVQFEINIGDLLMLGAVLSWSAYAVCVQRLAEIAGGLLLFLIACAAVPALLPWAAAELMRGAGAAPAFATLAAVAYLGAGATVLAVYLWNSCIRAVGANRAAIFVNLIPVFGVALAIGFLDERLAAYHVAGAALVLIGISLAVRRPVAEAAESGADTNGRSGSPP
jgi:drug/metabolite transporter (DMT)-like permease